MAEIKFHKANALPSPINSTHDGIWLITDGVDSYKHYVISGGDVKELTVDGLNLTLEQARQNGDFLEGDVIIKNDSSGQDYTGFINEGGNSKISFTDKDGARINTLVNDVDYYLSVASGYTSLGVEDYDLDKGIYISASIRGGEPILTVGTSGEEDSKGLVGIKEFDKQGDRKAYAQIADVEDAMDGLNLTLEEARQNGNVLEGDVIIENVSSGQGETGFISEDGISKISFTDKGGARISNLVDDVDSSISLFSGSASLGINDNDSGDEISIAATQIGGEPVIRISTPILTTTKGLIGSKEYDKQGDRNAYAQIADVEDAIDGLDLTLEGARQNGDFLEGDVIIKNDSSGQYETGFINEGGSSKITFIEDDGASINNLTDNVSSFMNVLPGRVILGVEDYDSNDQIFIEAVRVGGEPVIRISAPSFTTSKGLIGSREYDKQGDRKAYAQIADVEDAMEWSQADW